MALNNSDGNDVNPVQPENVSSNIFTISVAELVLMALNNSDGNDVKPVQPINVM